MLVRTAVSITFKIWTIFKCSSLAREVAGFEVFVVALR